MELVVETGSVILEAGDLMVDRGVMHGARSVGDSRRHGLCPCSGRAGRERRHHLTADALIGVVAQGSST